ncbi:MAG: hypothetical protein ACLFPU_08095 [Dehalococcoidia bacterium]
MKISRTYDAGILDQDFFQAIDVFIFGTVTDEQRNRRFSALWGEGHKPASYHLDYDLDTEGYSLIPTSLGEVPAKSNMQHSKRDITSDLRKHLASIGVNGKNLLIDITGLSEPVIFFMLKLVCEDVKPAHLFLAYTEPYRYKAKPLPSSEDVFELTERLIGLKALPGFMRRTIPSRKPIITLLIGFEGKRAKYVCDTMEIAAENIRVIFGFPGFRPGWQYLAYGSNQSMFEHFQAHRFMCPASANNPFEAYSTLEEILGNQMQIGIDSEMMIAPVGTKPHAVGAAMFVLHHWETTRLIYDFPVKARQYRSEGYGRTLIYNLSEFTNLSE